jgi:hypothetical protein
MVGVESGKRLEERGRRVPVQNFRVVRKDEIHERAVQTVYGQQGPRVPRIHYLVDPPTPGVLELRGHAEGVQDTVLDDAAIRTRQEVEGHEMDRGLIHDQVTV